MDVNTCIYCMYTHTHTYTNVQRVYARFGTPMWSWVEGSHRILLTIPVKSPQNVTLIGNNRKYKYDSKTVGITVHSYIGRKVILQFHVKN